MGDKLRTNNRVLVTYILGILLCIALWGRTCAAEEEDVFAIDARLLPSNDNTYDIQITIGNQGTDWEGTVQMRMEDSYNSDNCVYDTVLSLPQGSTKQFVVRIPKVSLEYTGGTLKVSLLNNKSDVAAQKLFQRFLLDGLDALSVGILSDSYSSLTYLDMEGESLYYADNELPIKLIELEQDNLTRTLDSLKILVIDNYNTSILTDEMTDSILQWVEDGGMLVVGTGRYAEDTLSGLEELGVECRQINEPGEHMDNNDYAADFVKFSLADLKDTTGQCHMDSYNINLIEPWGNGAVEFIPYALSDFGQSDLRPSNWEFYVWELLQNINDYTHVQYTAMQGYFDNNYNLRRIFGTFGNGGNRLNFGVLKWIVILYVIFVGPILYLILRFLKKRDWYWIAVPVTTLVGIFLVYFAGRGFEVESTRVYTVTVEKLSDQSLDTITYMHCYDAGHKEWGLQMAERYEYVGPYLENYFNGDSDKHLSRIRKEGDRIFVGRNPSAGFEDCYFIAGTSKKQTTGSISSDLIFSSSSEIIGTVTNETDKDFKRFAVINDNCLFIYGELPAGETCNLEEAQYVSNPNNYGHYSSAIEAMQGYMRDYYRGKDRTDADLIAALGTGVSTAYLLEDSNATLIVGVAENYDKTVDDDCFETSYGCFYSVQ